jgi:uncharacterized DUF497 family protein
MPFEFDKNKSRANYEKHGINFIQAQKLWEDIDRLIIPVRTIDEPRFMIISIIDGIIWSGIFTMRNENIRIISVRRAGKEEIALYES